MGSTTFNLSKPDRTVHVGVILTGGITELLDVAPIDMFTILSRDNLETFSDGPNGVFSPEQMKEAFDIDFHWVNEAGTTAKLTAGLTIQMTDSFASCPPLDIVIMGAHNLKYVPSPSELEFVRKAYDDCTAFITICGGFQTAMQAGLFQGKTATAPRPALDALRMHAPETNWVEKRWYRSGKLWTSGALLNGLDLMTAFGQETWGKEGTLMGYALDLGGWPHRDVDYADDKTAQEVGA